MIPQANLLAEHLAGMVRFPTVSSKNMDEMDFSVFEQFHKYLEDTYPLVHKTFKKEIIGRAGLLYHWEAPRKSEKLPLLLAAHQDVVPAGDVSAWTHPPFAGVIADDCLWGRGSLDCKNQIMGHMEALEALIAEGFQPDFDIYLAYGYNEEVSTTCGAPAAALLVKTLQERGVRLGMVLDEGGSVVSGASMGVSGSIANISVAEKGYVDIQLSKTGKGGHSARPGKTSIMADVARAVVRLSESPMPYRILPEIALQYRILADLVPERREIYQDIQAHQEQLFPMLDSDHGVAAKFQTTVAMTMAQGSYAPNVMPGKVSVTLNCRPLPGDTIDSVTEKLREIIGPELGVEVTCLGGRDPSPVSDIDTPLFRNLKSVIESVYPNCVAVPSICLGGTDSYFYYPICDHVYRFAGEYRVPQNGSAHAVNERIWLEHIDAVPKFFYTFLPTY